MAADEVLVRAIGAHDASLVEAFLCREPRAATPAALGAALLLDETPDMPGSVLLIVRSLIAHGTPLNRLCDGRSYPLHLAVQRTSLVCELLSILISGGAHLELSNTLGQTALHIAALKALPGVVRWLLECGANPNVQDLRGRSPLCVALQRRHQALQVAALLVEHGADVDRGNCLSSAINRCALLSDSSGLRALAFLLANGASPAACNSHGLAAWQSLLETNMAGPRLGAAYLALLNAGMRTLAPPQMLALLQTRLHGDLSVDPQARIWLPRVEKLS